MDARLALGTHTLLLEWTQSGDAATVASAIRQLEEARVSASESIPVVAVPYMGRTGQDLCREHGMSWVDLSGNARIEAPNLRIQILGETNRFKQSGRPATPFAPKSSRVARLLLQNWDQPHRQTDIATETGLVPGYVSRIVRRLIDEELLQRNDEGAVRVPDPGLLLRAWAEQTDFSEHDIVRGHVTSRSGEELLAQTAHELGTTGLRHAATGLGAAWLWTGFTTFRVVTWFVDRMPSRSWLDDIGFHAEDKGANLWWVVPRDEGVFLGMEDVKDVPCVHPVQAWLDLGGHPERSREAAEQLAAQCLPWPMP